MQRDSFRITLQNYYFTLSQSGGGAFFYEILSDLRLVGEIKPFL